ncbi:hypothetical protein ACFL6P_07895, partial [Candidatus Latescibacterota bacterium]
DWEICYEWYEDEVDEDEVDEDEWDENHTSDCFCEINGYQTKSNKFFIEIIFDDRYKYTEEGCFNFLEDILYPWSFLRSGKIESFSFPNTFLQVFERAVGDSDFIRVIE